MMNETKEILKSKSNDELLFFLYGAYNEMIKSKPNSTQEKIHSAMYSICKEICDERGIKYDEMVIL